MMRRAVPAIVNLALATAILIVGFPSITAALRRIPAEIVIADVEGGQPVEKSALDAALHRVEAAAATSPSAHLDVALLLLAGADGGKSAEEEEPASRAAEELRLYLAAVPGDARGWAVLARAELQRGSQAEAAAALKMSTLIAPYSPGLVLWRCGTGLDLYAVLDEEERHLLQQQFRIAAANQTNALVDFVLRRHAVPAARAMLVGDAEAWGKFEARLAQY